jgi:hypothetical protein
MQAEEHDDSRDARLDALLRGLTPREIDPGVDARVLRRARAVLVDGQESGGVMQVLQRLWERAVAPVLVTGTVASYLVWAVLSASALYR